MFPQNTSKKTHLPPISYLSNTHMAPVIQQPAT